MYTIYLGTGIAISVIGLRGNFSKEHFLLARLQPNVKYYTYWRTSRLLCSAHFRTITCAKLSIPGLCETGLQSIYILYIINIKINVST